MDVLDIPAKPLRGASCVPVFGRGRARTVNGYRALALGPDRFVALVDVPAVSTPTAFPLDVDGRPAGELHAEPLRVRGSERVDARVVICMATYEPPARLFEEQIASLRGQTANDWRCVVCDDGTSPHRLAEMRTLLGADERFVLVAHRERLGHFGNFERALEHVGQATKYVALADQDDRWHEEKLAALTTALEATPSARLAYCDCRVVDEQGCVRQPSFYASRRNNPSDLGNLLVANSVPGASAVMRRELLDVALPFPVPVGRMHHDHWLAVVALAGGGLTYVDRPLWDYVQHGANVIGHESAQASEVPPAWQERYARVYEGDLLRVVTLARTLGLRMPQQRIAAVRYLTGIEHDPRSWLSLLGRAVRSRTRLATSPTAGIEADLVQALLWRRTAMIRSFLR